MEVSSPFLIVEFFDSVLLDAADNGQDSVRRRLDARQTSGRNHAGDLVAPFAAKMLAGFERPVHVIYGNNDGERPGLAAMLPQIQDGPLHLDVAGRRILVHHFIDWCAPEDLARADVVVTGHTHEVVNDLRDGTLFLNPGECCGWVNGRCTAALLDPTGPAAEIIELTP